MNFQEKIFDTTMQLRTRAAALANVAIATARNRAQIAAKRVEALKGPLNTLSLAGREFNKVARRHTLRFVKENSSIAADAGRDVSALAQTTFSSLVNRRAVGKKTAKVAVNRKRTATRKSRVSKAA
jgi:hypothetical protein